jgi:hypothetical protein
MSSLGQQSCSWPAKTQTGPSLVMVQKSRCRSRPEGHRLERELPRAWTRPGPCRSTDHKAGAKWEPREGLAQAPSMVIERSEAQVPSMMMEQSGATSTLGSSRGSWG